MFSTNQSPRAARAFTLTELVAIATILALLALLIAPSLDLTPAQRITCETRLRQIAQGVAACFAENNGYGPTHDDGSETPFMLTWTDLLYDAGYIPHPRVQWCPSDERPDFVAEARGARWGFYFVDWFGVHEPIKHGVRTSYALNMHMSRNFAEDKFNDASRQVYAMDGWWAWIGNLNAAWALYEQVTGDPPPNPVDWPHWEGTMHGWRHGSELTANILYLDGHVAPLTPTVPLDPNGLLTDTVDTMQSFTWLPGERDIRYDWAPYEGEVEDYLGWIPYGLDPPEGTYKYVEGAKMPIDFPEELSCSWRTANEAWLRLPNDPRDRR